MITYSTLCNEFSQVNAYFAAKVYGRKGSIIWCSRSSRVVAYMNTEQ